MSKPAQPSDRRQFGRRQTNLHAWISVPGRPRLPCLVKDISVGGALLEFDKPSWLPFTFQLTIEATRFTTWCEIRHQGPSQVGVRFMQSVAAANVDPRSTTEGRSLNDTDAWSGHRR